MHSIIRTHGPELVSVMAATAATVAPAVITGDSTVEISNHQTAKVSSHNSINSSNYQESRDADTPGQQIAELEVIQQVLG